MTGFKAYRKEHNGVTWDQYLQEVILRIEETSRLREENAERSLGLAKQDMDRRLEAMNEFRAQLEKQAVTFLTTERYEACHGRLVDQIANLEKQQAAGEARAKIYAVVVAATISLLGALIVFVVTGR